MTCERCRWGYPSAILAPFQGSRHETQIVCGICALEMRNETHRTNVKRFDGETAEAFRQQAIQWRAKHPEEAPNK